MVTLTFQCFGEPILTLISKLAWKILWTVPLLVELREKLRNTRSFVILTKPSTRLMSSLLILNAVAWVSLLKTMMVLSVWWQKVPLKKCSLFLTMWNTRVTLSHWPTMFVRKSLRKSPSWMNKVCVFSVLATNHSLMRMTSLVSKMKVTWFWRDILPSLTHQNHQQHPLSRLWQSMVWPQRFWLETMRRWHRLSVKKLV